MSQPLNSCYLASYDANALLDDLSVFKDALWTEHVNYANYSAGWDAIPLRCGLDHLDSHPILQLYDIESQRHWVSLPILLKCPAIQAVLDSFSCPIHSARLMRLHSGAHIKPHRDIDLSVENQQARLHIPIQVSERLSFFVNNERIPMRAGELWYINADQTHEVINKGDQARINLVIDCEANDWLLSKIQTANTDSPIKIT